jgi:hypothetical protein
LLTIYRQLSTVNAADPLPAFQMPSPLLEVIYQYHRDYIFQVKINNKKTPEQFPLIFFQRETAGTGRQTRFSEYGVGGGLDVPDGNGGNSCASDEEGSYFAGSGERLRAKPQNARQM